MQILKNHIRLKQFLISKKTRLNTPLLKPINYLARRSEQFLKLLN